MDGLEVKPSNLGLQGECFANRAILAEKQLAHFHSDKIFFGASGPALPDWRQLKLTLLPQLKYSNFHFRNLAITNAIFNFWTTSRYDLN